MRFLLLLLFCTSLAFAGHAAESDAPTEAPEDANPAEAQAEAEKPNPHAIIKTSMGDIVVELYADAAPKTVDNFLGLAEGTKSFVDVNTGKPGKRPFYDGLIFHRVIDDFMIQGGCPLGNGKGGPGYQFADEIDAKALGVDELHVMDRKTGQPHPYLGIRSQQQFAQRIIGPVVRKLQIKTEEEFKKRIGEVQKMVEDLTLMDLYELEGYAYSDEGSDHRPEKFALAMANAGPNTNGSQFFLMLGDAPWLTGRHTVFGQIVDGKDVLAKIGKVETNEKNRPLEEVVIESIRRCDTEGNVIEPPAADADADAGEDADEDEEAPEPVTAEEAPAE